MRTSTTQKTPSAQPIVVALAVAAVLVLAALLAMAILFAPQVQTRLWPVTPNAPVPGSAAVVSGDGGFGYPNSSNEQSAEGFLVQ